MEDIEKAEYVYIKSKMKSHTIHYILISPYNDNNKIYTDKGFSFCIPTDNKIRCFCYKDLTDISIKGNTNKIYSIDKSEFLEIFREFVQNDGKYYRDLSYKLLML